MKNIKKFAAITVAASLLGVALAAFAAENKAKTEVKPYPLKTCIVSGEKLGEMGKPYVFTNDTREIKLCCKDCLKDFKKYPKKYVKKIEDAEAKKKTKSYHFIRTNAAVAIFCSSLLVISHTAFIGA